MEIDNRRSRKGKIAISFTIDYSCSGLSEEEIAAYMKQLEAEQAKERRQEEKRMKKARSFRFSGGLC